MRVKCRHVPSTTSWRAKWASNTWRTCCRSTTHPMPTSTRCIPGGTRWLRAFGPSSIASLLRSARKRRRLESDSWLGFSRTLSGLPAREMAVEHSAFIHGYWPQVVATAPDAEGLVAVTRREPRSDAFPHHRFNSALSPSVSPESARRHFRPAQLVSQSWAHQRSIRMGAVFAFASAMAEALR